MCPCLFVLYSLALLGKYVLGAALSCWSELSSLLLFLPVPRIRFPTRTHSLGPQGGLWSGISPSRPWCCLVLHEGLHSRAKGVWGSRLTLLFIQSGAKGCWGHSGWGCTLSSPQHPPLPVGGDASDGDRDVNLQCFQAPQITFTLSSSHWQFPRALLSLWRRKICLRGSVGFPSHLWYFISTAGVPLHPTHHHPDGSGRGFRGFPCPFHGAVCFPLSFSQGFRGEPTFQS